MIAGWQEQGSPSYASLTPAQQNLVESFLEHAADEHDVVAVQIEQDPEGTLLVNVWASRVTAQVAALVDESQAEGSRAGVSFVALRLRRPPGPEGGDGALWLTRPTARQQGSAGDCAPDQAPPRA